jgi:TolA-binding protein
MTSLWQAPSVVVLFVTWLVSEPTSLAEASRREAVRRQLAPRASTTLTNIGQPADTLVHSSAAEPRPADPPPAAPPAAGQGGGAAQPPGPEPAKGGEKEWREKIAVARQNLERNEVLVDAMQSRINSLQFDVVNRDDPAQQAQLRQQLGKAVGELDRLKKQVEADKKSITDIQGEARKQGVPPGWVR